VYVSHLSLVDFRSYAGVDVELAPGVNAFVGNNGQGKTNLVEAVGYVATLGSHRVANDAPLIRAGCDRAQVRARVVRGDRASTVELEINAKGANRARINRASPVRARDALGILRTVLFAPEDLALVKGDPDGRRTFLDTLIVQLLPRAAGILADYDRVNRQRAALLKSLRAARHPDMSTLDVWTDKAAALGAEIVFMRVQLIDALVPHVVTAYAQVSDSQGAAELEYRSSAPTSDRSTEELATALVAAMHEARNHEIDRGVSLVGPHRDDVVLRLGDLPAKGYASHGESWSFALALRLASYRLLGGDATPVVELRRDQAPSVALREPQEPPNRDQEPAHSRFWTQDLGDDPEPVLILDDVFAELDAHRRDRLAELVAPARQVLVTAAVPGDVPQQLAGVRFDVVEGQVTRHG
jgi:DNA replication and repair protein RecF